MLKKHAYIIAILYVTSIAKKDTSTKIARNIRNLMKPYMEFAREYENDQNEITNNKKLDNDGKEVERTILGNESVDVPDITETILDLCEEGKIELKPQDIESLYCFEVSDAPVPKTEQPIKTPNE